MWGHKESTVEADTQNILCGSLEAKDRASIELCVCVGPGCEDRDLNGGCESEESAVDRDLMKSVLLSTGYHFTWLVIFIDFGF